MRNTGCPFGDKAGYDELIAYLETLSRAAQQAAK